MVRALILHADVGWWVLVLVCTPPPHQTKIDKHLKFGMHTSLDHIKTFFNYTEDHLPQKNFRVMWILRISP